MYDDKISILGNNVTEEPKETKESNCDTGTKSQQNQLRLTALILADNVHI
jgi:hypothetical protein